MDSPSDLPSQLDYPAIIMEQPLEEEGTTFDYKFFHGEWRLDIYQFRIFLMLCLLECHI